MRRNPHPRANGSDGPVGYRADQASLTDMEDRVLELVSRAKTNKEIARALGSSPATVKRHIENLLKKLKLRNRVEAAVYGVMVKGCRAPDPSTRAFELLRKTQQSR